MANKSCGHIAKCGCESYLTTPPPCPTPENCPEAQPCSEVFSADCIVYSGPNLECNQEIIIPQNSSVSLALENLVNAFCDASGLLVIPTAITCKDDTVVAQGLTLPQAIENVIQYFCNAIEALPVYDVVAGDGISVAENTVGNVTTFTVSNTGVKKYTNSGNYPAATPTNVAHNLNTAFVTVSLVSSAGFPYTAYVHGVDYTYTIVDNNNISLTFVAGGFANITVIG